MAHLTVGVEYGLHCLLWLMGPEGPPVSSRDLADLQGISPSFVAKIFPKLEKAGIVRASEGVRGGYLLAKAPENISVLEVVDAIEGKKPLYDCQEIRGRCAVFDSRPPEWAIAGVCAIHAVMLRAEKAMRDSLASQSLADIGRVLDRKAPSEFYDEIGDWLNNRIKSRTGKPEKRQRSSEDGRRSGQ
jgi:Rrf2 family protein